MTEDEKTLTARWMRVFGEPPIIVDAELMRSLIAEHEAAQAQEAA